MSQRDLQYANLSNIDLTGSNFSSSNLAFANFIGATLSGVDFSLTNIGGTQLHGVSGLTKEQIYATASYQQRDLRKIDLVGVNLAGWNLSFQDLRGSWFGGSFAGANLSHARLDGAAISHNLANADLSAASLTRAHVQASNSAGMKIANAVLREAHLTGSFAGVDFVGVDLRGARLDADFSGALLAEVDLRGATLSGKYDGANFQGADLRGAQLSGYTTGANANFRNTNLTDTQLHGFFEGADFTNAIIRGASVGRLSKEQFYSTLSYQQRDLRDIVISHGSIAGRDLSGQDLSGAGITLPSLANCRFNGANLANAYVASDSLAGADFTGATINGAVIDGLSLDQLYSTASHKQHDLRGFVAWGNDFSNVDLSGQDLRDTSFMACLFTNANLSGAKVSGAEFSWSLAGSQSPFGLMKEQLYSTASYQQLDLQRIKLADKDLSSWDFSHQNLTGAVFFRSKLAATSFSQASVEGAHFGRTTEFGFLKEQLYSTASYQIHVLRGIVLSSNDLSYWDFSNQDLTDANLTWSNLTNANFANALLEGIDIQNTTARGFTLEQLRSSASYQQRNLQRIDFSNNDLTGWDFSNQDLTGASFTNANLVEAVFSGADVRSASFRFATLYGFTREQLYATKSYQEHDLSGIDLSESTLTGWDFSGQNLTGANLSGTSGANLTGATIAYARLGYITQEGLYSTRSYQQHDLRGVQFYGQDFRSWDLSGQFLVGADFTSANLSGANLSFADLRGAIGVQLDLAVDIPNTVFSGGHMLALDLRSSDTLVVRNADIPIHIDVAMSMSEATELRLVLTDDDWGSTMHIGPGVSPSLGGVLRVTFGSDVDLSSLVGRSFDLFDWNEPLPGDSRYDAVVTPQGTAWDLSQLYTTGDVVLTSVPEPSSAVIVLFVVLGLFGNRRMGCSQLHRWANSQETPNA